MKLQTFKNDTAIIHGSDPKRIGCDVAGVLKIARAEVSITPGEEALMPMLINGCTGEYDATFTTSDGKEYKLNKVSVRGGWIQPPPPTTLELMELRSRADTADDERDAIRDKLENLSKIFDTNSLNFLIK